VSGHGFTSLAFTIPLGKQSKPNTVAIAVRFFVSAKSGRTPSVQALIQQLPEVKN
jgi:hypothetical protein